MTNETDTSTKYNITKQIFWALSIAVFEISTLGLHMGPKLYFYFTSVL